MEIMRYRKIFFSLSGLLLLMSIVSLIVFRLKPSVDFAGGSLTELQFDQPTTISTDQITGLLNAEEDESISSVQLVGENRYVLKTSELSNEQKDLLVEKINQQFGSNQVLRYEAVGATVSRELLTKTVAAILIVTILITTYVWYQFKDFKFGVCAILAMFHDTIILIGAFSLLGHFYGVEVDMLFVSAVLTTLSFSVHDTIVVFDRIRELRRKHRGENISTLVNTAVLETISRSLNNSITLFIVLLSLVLLGGSAIRWFAVALLIGAVVGTYSSTFVAAPLLVVWEELLAKSKSKKS
jgi:preprotein translocase subunit SecF